MFDFINRAALPFLVGLLLISAVDGIQLRRMQEETATQSRTRQSPNRSEESLVSQYLGNLAARDPILKCQSFCSTSSKSWKKKCSWEKCASCSACSSQPIFADASGLLLLTGNTNWNHVGRLHNHIGCGTVFPDWNKDGYLDFLANNHFQPLISGWDFGINSPSSDSSGVRRFASIKNKETFAESDDEREFHSKESDMHGMTFADLDRDGELDLVVAVGGMKGVGVGAMSENLLFWGMSGEDGTLLVGGRDEARAAGIECLNCRGRFIYVTDANGDGLLDVMTMAEVRLDDLLTPGAMHMNLGNRKFEEDANRMREYSSTMVVTDADGDGFAQEYVVFRGSCFRDPAMGPYTAETIVFCEARPTATTAVYKYLNGGMALISPEYHVGPGQARREFVGFNSRSATSCVTGDFDNDQHADLLVLFQSKIVFYYSSERAPGELPLYNEDLGHGGATELALPCSSAVALRSVDLDNSGVRELVVFCKKPGEVFVYTLEAPKTWSLPRLGADWHLGDLNDGALASPTVDDLDEGCKPGPDGQLKDSSWEQLCAIYEATGKTELPEFTGVSFVDLNNDGFLDAVTSHKVGYQRFFINTPLEPRNQFIRFELKCTQSNEYAIGATLVFESSDLGMQFHEISSHGHSSDFAGNIDDRIVFGLGSSGSTPVRLTVRWPTMQEQVFDLRRKAASHISNYANPIVLTEALED